MRANEIKAQHASGLISAREARDALTRLANQSLFNANYSDTLPSYKRWIGERDAALRAHSTIRQGMCDPLAALRLDT